MVEETEVPEVPSKGERKKIKEDVDKANITSKSADGHTASRKKVEEAVKLVVHLSI